MIVQRSLVPRPSGFTMIELLVAVTVSVVLLSILAFVFTFSTKATQNANSRIAMTTRTRSLNIRMRQEIGNMLAQPRVKFKNKPNEAQTWDIDPQGHWVVFSAATDEDGRAVNVDVKYEFQAGKDPVDGALIRRRDTTGPYVLDTNGEVTRDPKSTKADPRPLDNSANYDLGDDKFFQDGQSAEKTAPSTIMMSNVRAVKFKFIDPPDLTTTDSKTQLNPRTVPAALEMEIKYGPERGFGDVENTEDIKIVFPIYRGL